MCVGICIQEVHCGVDTRYFFNSGPVSSEQGGTIETVQGHLTLNEREHNQAHGHIFSTDLTIKGLHPSKDKGDLSDCYLFVWHARRVCALVESDR